MNVQERHPDSVSVAKLKGESIGPQKYRLVADLVRGCSLLEASQRLTIAKKKAARSLLKLLRSAYANAEQKGTADLERLYVSELRVDEGPRMKRHMPRAQGRADVIFKRSSHVFLRLSEKKGVAVKGAQKAAPAKKSTSKKKVAAKKKTTKKKAASKKK